MMVKLCLMASHGYPPGSSIVFHQNRNRVIKDCQPHLPSITRSNFIRQKSQQHEEPWRPMNMFCESNQFSKIDSTDEPPVLIDVQDARPDSVLFSYGIVEQCTRHEKILQFLMSGSDKLERDGFDLSLLSELMGLQDLMFDVRQQSLSPLFYPSSKLDAPNLLVDFVGDMAHSSKLTVHPDGRVLLTGNGEEMKDILSAVAEFYLSKNSTMCRKQSMLVPQFSRFFSSEVHDNIFESSSEVKDVTAATLKSPEKIKPMSPKRKNARKGGRERDLYKRNYFHACESLLSLMMDKQHGKTAILSLKKSGPELSELLTQFCVGIAGAGIALLFSVMCKVACGRVPFCASRLFSTGIGFGLVWLSCAVNELKNTIVYTSKHASKLGLKDEEIMSSMDRSFREIYFRAVAVMAVTMLRFA